MIILKPSVLTKYFSEISVAFIFNTIDQTYFSVQQILIIIRKHKILIFMLRNKVQYVINIYTFNFRINIFIQIFNHFSLPIKNISCFKKYILCFFSPTKSVIVKKTARFQFFNLFYIFAFLIVM